MLCATVALAGCYMSQKLLLDPSQAATPLAMGRQTATSTGDDKPETVDIRLGPDHWYVIRNEGKDDRVLFTPLAGGVPGQPRYAFAAGEGGGFIYGVATRRQGALYFDLPSCGDTAAQQAAAAHGVVTPPGKVTELLASAIEKVCKRTPEFSTTGGTSDARFIRALCPVAEFGLISQTMHKTDECCALGDLDGLTSVYEAVLDGFFAG